MEPFTTRPELRGTLRHGRLDSLARLGRGNGDAGARRQRLRRGGGGRVRAAGGRAAPERARRRGADPALPRRARRGARRRRPGHRAGRGDDRALPRARAYELVPGTGLLAGLRARARSTPGCCSCASSGRCRSPRCWSRQSATPRTATRWCRASRARSRRWSGCSASEWPELRRALPAGRPRPGTLFSNPRPGRDLPAGARRVGRARGADRPPATPSTAASSPSAIATPTRASTAACSTATTSPRGGPRSSSRSLAPTRAGRSPRPAPWGQGPVFLQQLALLDGFELGERERRRTSSTRSSSAPSSPSPTARPGTATRHRRAARRAAERGVRGRAAQARRRRGVGRAAARQPGRARAETPAYPGSAGRTRNRRADPRRHVSRGRGRQLRQRGLGHAERRLAARLPRDPRARLLPWDAGADVLAGGRPAELAGAAQAPAHDALALDRAPRRRRRSPSARPAATCRTSGRSSSFSRSSTSG